MPQLYVIFFGYSSLEMIPNLLSLILIEWRFGHCVFHTVQNSRPINSEPVHIKRVTLQLYGIVQS